MPIIESFKRSLKQIRYTVILYFCSLLRGAEDITLHKRIRSEYGGGLKEFVYEDQEYFEGVEDSATFLNSQERQSIVKNLLDNLRATEDDQLGNIRFLDGQAIGKNYCNLLWYFRDQIETITLSEIQSLT